MWCRMIINSGQYLYKIALFAVCVVALLGLSQHAGAQKVYYKYEDFDGVVVINDHVPPELVHKGYSVIDALGRVVEIVPRALSERERRDLNSQQVQERLAKEQAERQKQYDLALLRRYSTIEDIEAAKSRKINEVKVRINILEGNIAGMRGQLENHLSQAAELERSGRTVPDSLTDNMNALREEIAESERMIKVREQQMENLEARFQYDIERFKTIKKTD